MACGISTRTTVDYLLGAVSENGEQNAAAAKGRDRTLYYTDGELSVDPVAMAAKAPGLWYAHGDKPPGAVQSLTPVDAEVLRRLDDNFDPAAQTTMTQQQGTRRTGIDITLSAPKSVSVLWAFADKELRDKIALLQQQAVVKSMDLAIEQGGFACRTGKAGAGERLTATNITAALFTHSTSRAGDMNMHTHTYAINASLCGDGVYRSIDPVKAVQLKYLIDMHYKAILAAGLRELGFGIDAHDSRQEHGFEVAGIPQEVLAYFSKETAAIQARAKEKGVDTSRDRKSAQTIAMEVRGEKTREGLTALTARWRTELSTLGWTAESLVQHAREHAQHDARSDEQKRREADGYVAVSAGRSALSKGIARHSELASEALKLSQKSGTVADTFAALDRAIERGDVLYLGEREGHRCYCTREFAEAENTVMSLARTGKGAWAGRLDNAMEIMEQREAEERKKRGGSPMTPEQLNAARHALGPDQHACVIGDPGTGKSFLLARVIEAAAKSGVECHSMSPSWRAARLLSSDLRAASAAIATAKFLAEVETGQKNISGSLIVVDESSMIDTYQMAKLFETAARHNAKLLLVGDTKQLPAVNAGTPFALLVQELGSARLLDIRRQKAQAADAARLFAKVLAGTDNMERAEISLLLNGYPDDFREAVEHGPLDLAQSAAVARLLSPAMQDSLMDERLVIGGRNDSIRGHCQSRGFAWQQEVSLAICSAQGTATATKSKAGAAEVVEAALQTHAAMGGVRCYADRAAAVKSLADAFEQDCRDRPDLRPHDRIIMARTHAEVAMLNGEIYARMEKLGRLHGEAVEIDTFRTGTTSTAKRQPLTIRAGMRLGIGCKVDSLGISPKETGTLKEVVKGKDGSVKITLIMDSDGREVAGDISQFVPDKKQGKKGSIPHLFPAFAGTVHIAQGSTAPAAYVLASGGGYESLIVALTRHNHQLRIFMDCAELVEKLAEKGEAVTVSACIREFSKTAAKTNAARNVADWQRKYEAADDRAALARLAAFVADAAQSVRSAGVARTVEIGADGMAVADSEAPIRNVFVGDEISDAYGLWLEAGSPANSLLAQSETGISPRDIRRSDKAKWTATQTARETADFLPRHTHVVRPAAKPPLDNLLRLAATNAKECDINRNLSPLPHAATPSESNADTPAQPHMATPSFPRASAFWTPATRAMAAAREAAKAAKAEIEAALAAEAAKQAEAARAAEAAEQARAAARRERIRQLARLPQQEQDDDRQQAAEADNRESKNAERRTDPTEAAPRVGDAEIAGRTGGDSKRKTGQSGQATRKPPPPFFRNCMRWLSEIPLAHDPEGFDLLLQGNVRENLGLGQPRPDSRVRRGGGAGDGDGGAVDRRTAEPNVGVIGRRESDFFDRQAPLPRAAVEAPPSDDDDRDRSQSGARA